MDILRSRAALSNALSGAAADAFSSLALYPLDTIKVQLQADAHLSLRDVLAHLAEHPSEIYKGVGSKLVQSVQQKFQYFYVYALLRSLYMRRAGGAKPGAATDLLIGYVSALQGLGTTMPLEVVNTRIITNRKLHKDHVTPGFAETVREVLEHEGFLSFYRTIVASAVLCVNPAITYVIFEEAKARLLERAHSGAQVLSTGQALLIGVVAKSIAAVVTFPFIRAKVVMSVWRKRYLAELDAREARGEAVSVVERLRPAPTLPETLARIAKEEGLGGLYKGLGPQLLKGVTNAALMLAAKEKIFLTVQGLVEGGDAP